ncbi:MAG: LysM peptidoglycan-binding domain-containing protein [Bacteroidota bacterium]
MKNLIWIILMGTSFTSLAQRYVLFNPVCMERQKYDVINGYGGESYITYAIELNDNEKVFLEVGKESEKYESRISRAVITCNSSSINRAMVSKVNSGAERIFIVLKEGQGRFRVSPVASAAYFKNSDRGIEYTGKDFSFTYNDLVNTASQNLANPSLGGRVFFVGASQYECMSAYTFSVSTQQNSNVGSDLTILPSIGVIEYRTNASGGVGTRRLTNVNAKNFRSIIQDKCNRGEGSFNENLTDRGGVDEPPLVNNRIPETTTTTRPQERPTTTTRPNTTTNTNTNVRPSNNPADYGIIARHTGTSSTTLGNSNSTRNTQPTRPVAATNDNIHTVAKGETLFRIAKKYGVTVNQLKDWNNLTNATIFVGTELYVTAPSATRDTGALVDRGGNINTDQPVTNPSNRNTNTATTNFDPQAEYHVLKRGETLAGVARLYGFTEEKFRQMNGLFPNESLPIGYRLKTSDCDCPAQDDYYDQRDDNYNRRDDDYYRDEFVDRGDNMDNGFDDADFRRSVNTPAPYYEEDRYERRIDATRTQIPLRDTRSASYDDRYDSRPESFNDNNISRLDARGTTFDDRNRTASPTSYNQGNSRLDIQFDRQQQLHLVKENETLYSIARRYRTTVSRLAEANNLDPREVLLPGQSIFIK